MTKLSHIMVICNILIFIFFLPKYRWPFYMFILDYLKIMECQNNEHFKTDFYKLAIIGYFNVFDNICSKYLESNTTYVFVSFLNTTHAIITVLWLRKDYRSSLLSILPATIGCHKIKTSVNILCIILAI